MVKRRVKKDRKKGSHLRKYLKAFSPQSNKMIDKAYKKLGGHEVRKTPGLDKALKKLSAHEEYERPSLDAAYKYLVGKRKLRA